MRPNSTQEFHELIRMAHGSGANEVGIIDARELLEKAGIPPDKRNVRQDDQEPMTWVAGLVMLGGTTDRR